MNKSMVGKLILKSQNRGQGSMEKLILMQRFEVIKGLCRPATERVSVGAEMLGHLSPSVE